MRLAWGAKVSAEFRRKVIEIAGNIGCDPSWLMACIAFESGRTFSPSTRNPASGATGLIQFMPATAVGLGTTTAALAQMSAEDQLNYVAAYLKAYADRIKTFADLYLAILWPGGIGKADNDVIFYPGSQTYLANRGLDVNHDGSVTKAEAASFPAKLLEEGLQDGNAFELDDAQPAAPIEDRSEPDAAQPQGKPMPLLLSLLPAVLSLFAPRAQAALQKVTGAAPDVVGQFAQSVIDKVSQVTGQTDPIQAVAAITKDPDPAQVEQVQEHALDYLDKLAPVLDKLESYDAAAFTASESSKDSAGTRALKQQEAGVWNNPTFILALLIMGLVAAVVLTVLYKDVWTKGAPFSTDMQAFVIGAIVGSALTAVIGFYFGSSRSSSAKDVLIGEMARQTKQ